MLGLQAPQVYDYMEARIQRLTGHDIVSVCDSRMSISRAIARHRVVHWIPPI